MNKKQIIRLIKVLSITFVITSGFISVILNIKGYTLLSDIFFIPCLITIWLGVFYIYRIIIKDAINYIKNG